MDIKQQKKLNSGLSEMSLESHDHILQRCPSSEIVADSNYNLEYKICESPNVVQPKAVIDQHPPKASVCAFCYSAKTTEVSYQYRRNFKLSAVLLYTFLNTHSTAIIWKVI